MLADEMGLGKTVSALAYVASLLEEACASLPVLIVVPLATISNWMDEAAHWLPKHNVVMYAPALPSHTRILKITPGFRVKTLTLTLTLILTLHFSLHYQVLWHEGGEGCDQRARDVRR